MASSCKLKQNKFAKGTSKLEKYFLNYFNHHSFNKYVMIQVCESSRFLFWYIKVF